MKKIGKKLNLNKKFVSGLNKANMSHVIGGEDTDTCIEETDDTCDSDCGQATCNESCDTDCDPGSYDCAVYSETCMCQSGGGDAETDGVTTGQHTWTCSVDFDECYGASGS